jgi:hypothetical protein
MAFTGASSHRKECAVFVHCWTPKTYSPNSNRKEGNYLSVQPNSTKYTETRLERDFGSRLSLKSPLLGCLFLLG